MNHRQMEKGKQSTNALLLSDSLGQEEKPFEEAKEIDPGWYNISASDIIDEKLILKLLGDSRFQLKFILEFTKTQNFKIWLNSFSPNISCLNPLHPFEDNVQFAWDNGDYYKGGMKGGKKQGKGTHYSAGLTYIGNFDNNNREGEGTLTSEKDDYIYDGQWHQNLKHGHGMEVSSSGKYTGAFFRDLMHGEGTFVDSFANIYSGQF